MLDLAIEAHDLARARTGKEIPGVKVTREELPYALVTVVRVETEEGERAMEKPRGTYITVESPALLDNNRQVHQELIKLVGEKLRLLLQDLPETASALVVGLGNWHATPDALGPRTVDYTLVTRHLFHYVPQELQGGLREVSALAPGVLGITGIETAEIIRGVVEKIRPDVVITVDALAARSVSRIATSIQLADTGINPGSGIGSDRTGITREIMGVPVIAVGVPTVVHAAFIAQDAMEKLWEELKRHPRLQEVYRCLHPEVVQRVLDQLLAPFGGRLMVTPKEIDTLVQNTARILAGGLAVALHPGMNPEDTGMYLY
ncbi:GPR endopeptidase [Desulfothermobacter acidiphilus]|uniref:GPR endopeptidase n=1 Tax=Desulfothermobacter acidiphilus TaxID=1938353 RepID=UPI003F8929DF